MLRDFIALIYPRVCMACGNSLYSGEKCVCTFCTFHLPRTHFHMQDDNPVARIFWGRLNVRSAASFYYFGKEGRVQRLIHQLKYKGQQEIGTVLGRMYGAELMESSLFRSVDRVIPVPLHKQKLKKRGYNQSELFARGLAESMSIECDSSSVLRRTASESQTRKGRYKRWENVESVFSIKDPSALENKHLLLVDDVITTGATMEACASKILEIKGVSLSLASIAYAQI